MTGRMYERRMSPATRTAAQVATLVIFALGLDAATAAAESLPGTPVFEASGYGVLVPWFDLHGANFLAMRPADAGGAAELTTFTMAPWLPSADRWRVSPAGVPYHVGSVPLAHNATAAIWVDVNGDGVRDLVVGEDTSPLAVQILLMGPSGPIAPGRTYVVPKPPLQYDVYYLTSADVNGDGRLDIGVVSGGDANGRTLAPASMAWMLASGDSFIVAPEVPSNMQGYQRPTPIQFRAGEQPWLVNWLAPSLGLDYFSGNGDGTFTALNDGVVVHPASGQPLAADFDHDGFMDFVAGRYLYRGNATGVPTLVDSLSADVTAIVNLDHDGVSDLVAVKDGAIQVAHGLGGFNFAPFTGSYLGSVIDQYTLGAWFGLSSVGDVTGDGWSDVIGTSPYPRRVIYVAPGKPGGAFPQPARIPAAATPVQVALADVLGGDGKLDLLVLERGTNQLEVRPGTGDGTFGAPQLFALPSAPRRLAVADLDGDGRKDVIIACDSPPMICVLPNTGSGFAPPLATPVADTVIDLQMGDIDGDGHLDVLASGAGTTPVYLRGLGGFSLAPATVQAPTTDGHGRLVDLDKDGRLDLLSESNDKNPYYTFAIGLGDGQGTFEGRLGHCSGGRYSDQYYDTFAHRGTTYEVGDLLGDGHQWVAYASADSFGFVYSYFRAVRWDCSGLEGLPEHYEGGLPGYELPPSPKQLAIADVTLDGIPDVLSLSDKTGTLTVLPGLGQGLFGTPSIHVVGPDPVSFALGDVDGDGKVDVVVADGQINEVWVMRNLESFVAGVAPSSSPRALRVSVLSAPNAAVVRLQVSMPTALAASVELFDTQGRRLARQRLDPAGGTQRDVIFEGGSLPGSGVLFARVTQAGSSATTRMLRFR